jgi:hypothetical protein
MVARQARVGVIGLASHQKQKGRQAENLYRTKSCTHIDLLGQVG